MQRHGCFYHHPRWIDALRESFGLAVHYVGVSEDAKLVGGLPLAEIPALLGPHRLVSLPFSFAAGVIATGDESAIAVMGAARDFAMRRGIRRLEIKQHAPAPIAFPGYSRLARYSSYPISTSDGHDAVWQRLHASSTRRSIRKGQKAGVTAAICESPDEWRTMAELQEITSHRHGLPAPPRRFFVDVCRRLQQRGLADLYLARQANGDVASGVVIWKGQREWIYAFGASRPESLEVRPNHIALWQALQHACDAGVTFDMGRAAPEQTGLVEFKRRWGAEPVPLATDFWPAPAGLNVRRRDAGFLTVAGRVWSALPAPVARLGSVLYKYLG